MVVVGGGRAVRSMRVSVRACAVCQRIFDRVYGVLAILITCAMLKESSPVNQHRNLSIEISGR